MTAKSLSSIVPPGARVLWVASSGGHFTELRRIAAESDASADSAWVTFGTEQTDGATAHGRTFHVPYVAPRDWKGVARTAAWTSALLKRHSFDLCVSTGAALALGVLPVTAAHGVSTHYIESISRVEGPSLTGRILQRVPRVQTYTQHRQWADKNWGWAGSVLDAYTSHPRSEAPAPRKIFVTLGTIRPYRFDRAVDAILDVIHPDDEVVWQLGCTTRQGLPGRTHTMVSPESFHRYAVESDITVTHAGVGTLMNLLDLGITPSIVVRENASDEHVDDHQRQIADEMVSRKLAFELDLTNPKRADLERSALRRAVLA